MNKTFDSISEKLSIGLLLAMVGGFLDAYTYLIRSKVFANAQTGNMVLFGINLMNKQYIKAFYYFLPIFAYFLGIMLALYLERTFKSTNVHWRQLILIFEILVLLIVGIIPAGNLNSIVNILISFICALQVQAFTKVHGLNFASTMCTGNLIKAANSLNTYFLMHNTKNIINFLKYILIIGVFIFGAIMGAIFSNVFIEKAIFFPIIILFIVLMITIYSQNKIRNLIK